MTKSMIDIKIARQIVEKGFNRPTRDLSAEAYGRAVKRYILCLLDAYEDTKEQMDNVKWELDE